MLPILGGAVGYLLGLGLNELRGIATLVEAAPELGYIGGVALLFCLAD